ncbi:MAG: Uma2 family endonuclease [Spirosomataceae bacterium]
MGEAALKKYYTVEEYFELDNNSEVRFEYFNGEIFAMAGTTKNHNKIVRTVGNMIDRKFGKRGCDVFTESVKLEVIERSYYPYPDVVLTCHSFDKMEEYLVKYPSFIVEVLSKSTETYDRGFKLKRYKTIPSLKYYMIISQYECGIELYGRIEKSDVWTYQTFESMDDVINLLEIDFEMKVAEIYENIVFQPQDDAENMS